MQDSTTSPTERVFFFFLRTRQNSAGHKCELFVYSARPELIKKHILYLHTSSHIVHIILKLLQYINTKWSLRTWVRHVEATHYFLIPYTRFLFTDEFRSQAYWEKFFKHRAGEPFEWYGDWQQLGSLVKRRVGPEIAQGSILQVGCGNSELSAQMYDDGFQNITNIDFSKVRACPRAWPYQALRVSSVQGCIAEMMGKNLRARPKMRWLVMDALAMKVGHLLPPITAPCCDQCTFG